LENIMKTAQYQSASRSARSLFAVVAVATVVALFDFVAGLGETNAEALAALQAGQVDNVASAAAQTGRDTFEQ
jgi:hypothetical protein